MKLRRGFKTEANNYARDLRAELGKQPHEALCPWLLAQLLEIPILKLSDFSESSGEAVSHLTTAAQDEFSAVSVFDGRRRLIVHNDSHHPCRQAANIAHELSHAVLMHPPTPPFNDNGERNYSDEIKAFEDEANWLGPALLISEEAALHIVKQKLAICQAIQLYGVSEKLINMRINVTGAKTREYRSRKTKRA
jgi:Zn-dependent peptidase ImmA (M78 family)